MKVRDNSAEFGDFARGNGTLASPCTAIFGQIALFLSAVSLLQRNLARSGYVAEARQNQSLIAMGLVQV